MRRSLNLWFESKRIHPIVVGEFDDSALTFSFGQSGVGAFPAPTAMESKIQRDLGVERIGRAAHVRERFYALSLERQLKRARRLPGREAEAVEVVRELAIGVDGSLACRTRGTRGAGTPAESSA